MHVSAFYASSVQLGTHPHVWLHCIYTLIVGRILWVNIFYFRCPRSPTNFYLHKIIDFDTLNSNFNVVTLTNLQF